MGCLWTPRKNGLRKTIPKAWPLSMTFLPDLLHPDSQSMPRKGRHLVEIAPVLARVPDAAMEHIGGEFADRHARLVSRDGLS
jgi:hypothetical protein